ncbi:DUF3347 domain-containing protein [Mucilaginibacter aquariorum]|uniref:DUF3347 domain-containing protein n=1 Tax=Mucilaginibacter aquariorum TaxID=2967225 RepID=A0ABT1SXY1_9SPHI|nr:DUF3347 domain-containing protein [Mucilaginibacter aquariorum]MCQ6957210.1 DUF3347 domain-containing protein [Mucilaginibacter aquariorum]
MKTLKPVLFSILLFVLNYATAYSATKNDTSSILNAYYEVKNALVIGTATTVNAKAKDLITALTSISATQLTAKEKAVWSKYADKLKFDARHISESADISHQREHFASLSLNMFELVKSLKINTAIVYRQYCPMKKSYWLSESSTIENPYYGDQMLTCGEVKETLDPSGK